MLDSSTVTVRVVVRGVTPFGSDASSSRTVYLPASVTAKKNDPSFFEVSVLPVAPDGAVTVILTPGTGVRFSSMTLPCRHPVVSLATQLVPLVIGSAAAAGVAARTPNAATAAMTSAATRRRPRRGRWCMHTLSVMKRRVPA